jgi:hypothetical protein
MSWQLKLSSVVLESVEDPQHDRYVGVFVRPVGSLGFDEFRRPLRGRAGVLGSRPGTGDGIRGVSAAGRGFAFHRGG